MNHQAHDELGDRLRDLFSRLDPVPGEVTEYAEAAVGWRRLDADLAELLADSALAAGASRTRAGEPTGRSLTFAAAEVTIDLEIEIEGDVLTALGQLAPAPESATVEVQAEDGSVAASAESDTLGRFRLKLEGGGRVRLRVRSADATPVETSWFSL